MKRFNFFETILPHEQQKFFSWLRVSIGLIGIILFVCLCLTGKLLYDIVHVYQATGPLQQTACQFETLAEEKQTLQQQRDAAGKQRAMLKKMTDTPDNPYIFINAITSYLTQGMQISEYTISNKEGLVLKGQGADLTAIDAFIKKLIAAPLFGDIVLESIERGLSSEADRSLLHFKVRGRVIG